MLKTSLPRTCTSSGFIAEIGAKHKQYNDATILIQFKNLILLAMFDVSTTRPLPKDVVLSAFIQTFDEALTESNFSATAAALFELLQRFVESLNHSLKGGSSSVAVACIDAGRVWGYCAGDIRMGMVSESMLVWLSPVHTAANINSPFTDDLKQHPQRHLLTRVLRPHRPFNPDYFEYMLAEGCYFVAASDGFWCDQHWGNLQSLTHRPAQKPEDDCTCIWFSPKKLISSGRPDLKHEQLMLITKYQETVIGLT